MTIDDRYYELPRVLLNVAHIMSQAQQQVADEFRFDETNELIDTMSIERRQYRMWERLNSTHQVSSIQLSSGATLTQLSCQHACEEWIVLCDAQLRYAIPTHKILSGTGVGTRAITRDHLAISCGLNVLANHAGTERGVAVSLSSGELLAGQVEAVWRDCIDIRVWHEVKTVPFQAIDFVRVEI